MIDFACAYCGKVYAVGDEHAGRDALCGRCRAVIAVPAAAPREVVYAPPPPEPDFDDPDSWSARRAADRRRARARRKTVVKLVLLVVCLAGIAVCVSVIRGRVQLVDQGKARVGW